MQQAGNNTPKTTLVEIIAQKTHKVTADYMIERYNQSLKIVSKVGSVFLFNQQNCLWFEFRIEQLETHITYILQYDLETCFEHRKKETQKWVQTIKQFE
jgi:hypothetical protein